jgi:aspartyl-tRNA synthetase
MPSVGKVSCGSLDAGAIGETVELSGWVHRRRDHGGLVFIDIRDHDGITQIVFDPQHAATFEEAQSLRSEDVVRVAGDVRRRPEGTGNPKLATGAIEVAARELTIVNRSLTPPFVVSSDAEVDEGIRMRYRYLDLRRPRMQSNLKLRHRIVKAMRDYFDELGFIEIETPCLIKSTPEGARDYLVPSRLNRGSFYALPQSPQLLKQILMIGGMGRYMQIARCFRDEDLRADRQPEFTQLDVEMSFVDQEDVMRVMEGCMRAVWERVLDAPSSPYPRFTYAEAIRRFGSDKPDIRFGLELVDVIDLFGSSEFSLFRTLAAAPGNRIAALRYPGGASLSRRDFDALTEIAKGFGAKGLAYLTLGDELKGPIAKFVDAPLASALRERLGADDGDALLFVGDAAAGASDVAGRLRLVIGERLGLRGHGTYGFCWVVGFPLFERDPETGELTFAHHPFTSPEPGQEALFESAPLELTARHYDLVLNGYELGSGSIRNHDPIFQRKVFETLGLSERQIEDRFGFFMEALQYGAPPHGGMALGIDRIAMIACGEDNIREVIAFPKNQQGRDVMMDAPSPAADAQLRDLGIALRAAPATPAS